MENKDKELHDMLKGPVLWTFLKYCVPWTFSILAMGSATVIDGMFVGRYVGAIPLATLNLVTPLFSLFFGFGMMIMAGGSVRCGNYLGEGNKEAASAMMAKVLVSLAVFASFMSVLGTVFIGDLVKFLGATGELAEACEEYLYTFLFFGPFVPAATALSGFVRIDQRPLLASVCLILTAVINIILDALFVAHWGWGLRGAAFATGLAYTLPSLILVTHFFSPKCSYSWPKIWGKWSEVLKACWLGTAGFVNEMSGGFIIMLLNWTLMDYVGSMGVAAFSVLNYIIMMGLMLFFGISDSMAPIISVNRGAKRIDRMHAFLRTAMVSVTLLSCCVFFVMSFFPETLVRVFIPGEKEVMDLSLLFMHAARWLFFFKGLTLVTAAYFTGRQWPNQAITVALCRSLLFPTLFILSLPRLLGWEYLFYAMPLAEAFSCCIALTLLVFSEKKDNRKIVPSVLHEHSPK